MTKVGRKMVKCSKCGKESEQLLVFSVNYLLGDRESNDNLINHKQKCPYCGYENINIEKNDSNSINKLKREKLIELTEEFMKQNSNFEIFKIPNELYLDYFGNLENAFKEHSFESDERFVTYGRLNFLKEELSQRLNDEKLKYEEPNSVWGKDKWDNRMGAFIDLWDYIRGDRWFTPPNIPEGKNFKEILSANDQYYKEGFICEQEKNILLEMVNEIKIFINSKQQNYEYEFIPYKKIGSISLDKFNENEFECNGTKYIKEHSFNHAHCRPIIIDHPEVVKRSKGKIEQVYIVYNDKKIELTCSLDKFVNSLNQICDDIIMIEKDNYTEDINSEWKTVYSRKLGIIANAMIEFNKEKEYFIQSIHFIGKKVFETMIEDIFNRNVPIRLQTFDKDIYTIEQQPWIEYLEIDENTHIRMLRKDTPKEIEKKYNEYYENKITHLVNIKSDNYIFITSYTSEFVLDEQIKNCFIDLKNNKIYNYRFDDNEYYYYKNLTTTQIEKLQEFINNNDLLNISPTTFLTVASRGIKINLFGKTKEFRISDEKITPKEMKIFNDLIEIVLDNDNKLGNNNLEVEKLKNKIFEIENHDWGLKLISNWNKKIWYIYDDLSVDYEIINGQEKRKLYSHCLNDEKIKEIIRNIDLAKLDNRVVNAFDGEAWKFVQYKNNNIVWERDLGYIYGIGSLEKISYILLDLVKNDSDVFIEEESEENNMGLFSKKNKYDIKPENNRPQIVYGPPQFMIDKNKKYNVEPDENVPREVYGIPSPLKKDSNDVKDKYDVKPEQNVPQKVYGVMNPNISFDKNNKESVNMIISNYCLSLTKWSNGCDILYMDKNKESFIKDSIITVPIGKFDEFVQRLNKIIVLWNNEYFVDEGIEWEIKVSTKDISKNILGKGCYPYNWNEFIDLISEYEILFKKTIAYDKKNEEKLDLNTSFEKVVEARVKDLFFTRLICEYFKNEINKSDAVLKIIFKDVSKYDDIFNEFNKYLIKKTYDLPNPVSVEGYTAKQIAELNPNFKATGVYTFLNYLREKPDEAKDIIKKGFPNKDTIPPAINAINNKNIKLKSISAIEKIGIPTKQHENTILFVSNENAVVDNQKELLNEEKFENICDVINKNLTTLNEIKNEQTVEFLSKHAFYDDRSKTFSIKLENEEYVLSYRTGTNSDQFILNIINEIIGILKDNSNNSIKKIDFGPAKFTMNKTYLDENGHEVDDKRIVEINDEQ